MAPTSAQRTRPDDDRALPATRPCSRCDGKQELVASDGDFGKYLCDDCGMAVGVDLGAVPPEFMIFRGMPRRYTKDVFGDRLLTDELRLNQV